MKIIYLSYLAVALFSVPSQPVAVESYEDSVKSWNIKSWEKMYINPDTALLLSGRALELSRKINDQQACVQSAKMLGIAHDVKSNFDSALHYYQYALKLSRQNDDIFSAGTLLSNTGLTYLHKGDLINALKNFLEARKYFEIVAPASKEMANTSNNIGLIYLRMEDYGKALPFFNHAMPIFEKHNDKIGRGALLTNIANVYSQTGRFQDAVNTLMESIEQKLETNDRLGLCIAYNKMGSLMLETDSLDKALWWVEQSLELASRIDNQNTVISAYHLMQKVFSRKGEFKKAIRYTRMALDMSIEIGARRLEAVSYKYFAELYRQTGDYYNAFIYLQRYDELQDSLTSQEQLSKVYDMQLDFEMQKKSDEIALLVEQQKVQELELEKKQLILNKRNQFTISIAMGFGALLLLLYSRYRKYKHVQQLKMELATLNHKEQQTKKVLEAEVKERKRIGEELHDGLGQILGLVKMNITDQLDQLPSEADDQHSRFQSLLSLTNNAFFELRNISHNLSPILLQEKGLAISIIDMVNRLRNSNRYIIELDINGLEKPMDPLIEHSIYRIIQEFLNNIMRHASAKHISIQIVSNKQELSLIVEDDGRGFDPQKSGDGMGLKNLHTRINNLGGTIDIDTMPGRGSIFSVSIPL